MDTLTEHQFHTVWTTAVGRKGYDKKFFQSLLEELKKKKLIAEKLNKAEISSQVCECDAKGFAGIKMNGNCGWCDKPRD